VQSVVTEQTAFGVPCDHTMVLLIYRWASHNCYSSGVMWTGVPYLNVIITSYCSYDNCGQKHGHSGFGVNSQYHAYIYTI